MLDKNFSFEYLIVLRYYLKKIFDYIELLKAIYTDIINILNAMYLINNFY